MGSLWLFTLSRDSYVSHMHGKFIRERLQTNPKFKGSTISSFLSCFRTGGRQNKYTRTQVVCVCVCVYMREKRTRPDRSRAEQSRTRQEKTPKRFLCLQDQVFVVCPPIPSRPWCVFCPTSAPPTVCGVLQLWLLCGSLKFAHSLTSDCIAVPASVWQWNCCWRAEIALNQLESYQNADEKPIAST